MKPTDDTPMSIEKVGNTWWVRLPKRDILSFRAPRIDGALPDQVATTVAEAGWHRVSLLWTLDRSIDQDELAVEFELPFHPDFHWIPHLAPEDGYVVGQHVFRAPAIVLARQSTVACLVPDLDLVGHDLDAPWFLDLDAPAGRCWIGMGRTEIPVHVGFRKAPGMRLGPGDVELAFYVCAYDAAGEPPNPWARVSAFLWDRWARPLYAQGEPGRVPMDRYVEHTYAWAFDRWSDAVWQEFEIDGRRVGAPQFIVNVTQSPNYPGAWRQREFLSIWNQAWFSSLRSASGLARWARRTGDAALARKADLTKELALAAPMRDGIFPSVIRTGNERVTVDGKEVVRPRPWSEATWTNSNRCPRNHGISAEWYHVLDASWTCLLMLRWHEEIEADPRLLGYARRYAEKLVTLQDRDGFFPGWLHPETLQPGPVMNRTPETALSATFLYRLGRITGEPGCLAAARRAVDALLVEIVPEGRWEDYETYWSCSGYGDRAHVGRKFERNNMYKQNTLSMFWTAEALLEAYRAGADPTHLAWGRRTLDELSMYQQVWHPPFIYVPALGGFGVMNFDGEWNDSRQSLFAQLFLEYAVETGEPRYFERGVAALKSSFIMMYCPENPEQKVQWEKAHPFFGPADYGFTMENYAHGGRTSPEGEGMGTFTIYDWGNGAAAEARNRVRDRFGDVYIDLERNRGFGIDSVSVETAGGGFRLRDLADSARGLRAVFSDDSSRDIHLDGSADIRLDTR